MILWRGNDLCFIVLKKGYGLFMLFKRGLANGPGEEKLVTDGPEKAVL